MSDLLKHAESAVNTFDKYDPTPSVDLIDIIKRLIAEVERLGRANAVYLDAFSQEQIESLTKERDELSKRLFDGGQYHINQRELMREQIKKLEAENTELKKKENYWRMSYYKKEKQFTDSEKARLDAEEKQNTLFDAIEHGDRSHKSWLRAAIEDHFK